MAWVRHIGHKGHRDGANTLTRFTIQLEERMTQHQFKTRLHKIPDTLVHAKFRKYAGKYFTARSQAFYQTA